MGIVYCLLFTNILVYWSSLSMSILGNLLKFVKAKLQRKENGKSKTMVRLFFIFWIRSNIFRDKARNGRFFQPSMKGSEIKIKILLYGSVYL